MRCKKEIWSDWSHHQCSNTAKYGDHCGVHSPEKQAERRKARGPTQFEREIAGIRKAEERRNDQEAETRRLRKALEEIAGMMIDGASDLARAALRV